jgi:site-specific recombinase XerD
MADKTPGGNALARQRATVEGWLSAQTSENTRSAYRSDLETFGDWCAREGAIPLTADSATLIAFQAARELAGDSGSTIRRRWSAMSSFYDFAVDHQLRSTNPARGAVRPKVVSGDPSPTVRLSDEAVASCRAVAAALDPRLEALVALLVRDGLKVTEALALDIDDLSGKPPATITVRRRGQSKRIVLDHDSARAVRRCVGKRRTGPVFVSERSSKSDTPPRLTRFGADHLIRQLRTNAATQHVTANALRRFHITEHQLRSSDLDDIRDRAGLADVRSVRRYVDPDIEAPTTRGDVAHRRVRQARNDRSR